VTSRLTGPLARSFTAASHLGWWIVAGCGVLVLAGGIITTTPWADRTAAATALRLTPDEVGAGTGPDPRHSAGRTRAAARGPRAARAAAARRS
jgi:hypothetical protein